MVNEDEHSEVEMRCRIQQRAKVWGKVEGVMLDRRNILKKLKRNVLRACVTQACLNLYLVTVALTEQQQQLQCWFWFCQITRTKRCDERRMNDLRKYVMQQNSSTGRLVSSKVKWVGHMVRMDEDILEKRLEEKGEKTSRMQEKGNEQLRSKDCVRWDMRRSGEDERWRGGR